MIWFPFYTSDFLGATIGLSFQERSAYALMLAVYYERQEPFPTDKIRTYRMLGCESDEQKRAVDHVLEEFFILREDGWYQERAEKVLTECRQAHIDAVERGKKSAEVRLMKYGTAQPRKPFENLSKSSGNASELTTSTSTTITTSKSTSKPKTNTKAFSAQEAEMYLCGKGLDKTMVQEWLAIRKAKKLVNTETGFKAFEREAVASGLGMERALRKCVEDSWGGFKAKWLEEAKQ